VPVQPYVKGKVEVMVERIVGICSRGKCFRVYCISGEFRAWLAIAVL
jgi:hypothetical protein